MKVWKTRKRDQDLLDVADLVHSARVVKFKKQKMPNSVEEQNEIGDDLINWASDSDSVDIDDFFAKYNWSPLHFRKACKLNEYLSECLDVAYAKISSRIGALIKGNQFYLKDEKKMYGFPHREAAQARLEADADKQIIVSYKEEKIGIPVFTTKKDKK